jgi:hypothetical protein
VNRSALYLLLLVFGLAVPVRAELEVVYDHFNGSTTVQTKRQDIISIGRPEIILVGVFAKEGGQPAIGMGLLVTDPRLHYRQCHTTEWLVDNQPISLPQPEFSPGADKRGLLSRDLLKILPLTLEQVVRLTHAQKIEYRVCRDEFTVTSEGSISYFLTFFCCDFVSMACW